MRVIAAVHDITPARLPAAMRLRDLLEQVAPGPACLLVIPRAAGIETWRGSPGVAWLRGRVAAGDEVVLHGYSHVTRRGRDGAETAGRPLDAVADIVAAGAEEMRHVGITAHGFIAPAYGRAEGLADACAAAGVAWWATRCRLHWAGGAAMLPSLGLGASTPVRRALSPVAAAAATALYAAVPAVRLDVHTADLDHPRLARAAGHLVRRLTAQGRSLATHGELIRAWSPGNAGEARNLAGG